MKYIVFVYAIFAMTLSAHAQSPSWYWVKNDQANQFSSGYEIISDGGGNLIVSGTFQGKLAWGGDTLYQILPMHAYGQFVMSIKNDGSINWLRQVGGSNTEQTVRLSVDEEQNVYALAYVKDTLQLGDTLLYGKGAYLFKFNQMGQRQFVFALPDGCTELSVSNQKDIYVGGVFNDSITIGGITLMASVYQQLFVARFDPALQFKWIKDFGLGDFNKAASLNIDEAGSIYFKGAFTDSISFGSIMLYGSTPGGCSECAIFLTKMDSTGNVLWATNGNIITGDVLFNNSGDIAISGYFPGTGYFGSTVLSSEIPPSKKSMLVATINSEDGSMLNHQIVGILKGNFSYRMALDTNSNYYVALYGIDTAFIPPYLLAPLPLSGGEYKGNMVVARFDSSGTTSWAKNALTSFYSYNRLRGITIGADGGVYVTGVTAGDAYFDGFTLTTGPSSLGQVFVAKLDQTTGINPLNGKQTGFTVYPNPAGRQVTISWQHQANNLAVFDVTGRCVYRQQLSASRQTMQIQTGTYAAGMYYIRLSGLTGSSTQKLIVVN